ncbi:B-cell receptor CD22 isoform X1 [Ctenopharyngodon idella]|uniref:B-cell receptor CD22 isoform X1 n=1 Tax=Ctenopharyngodon idella TaxID=7959 RepID=UPI0022313308|nr:B-cell receptor CD22 isoform X1 [Ctenopharyngodon idella]
MFFISIFLQLSLSAALASWSVSYKPRSICVFERSSVDFTCSFDYPSFQTLKTTKWFKPNKHQKQDGTQQGIFVHHSEAAEIDQLYKNRTVFANQDKNCSLQLYNVSKSDIGKYFFRLETNYYRGKYTGPGGIYLNVAVLPFRVTVTTQKVYGHIHEGDSVTLRCSTENCTPEQGPFAWFKNHLLLPQATENELQISSVSHNDFGNYSCGLKNSSMTSADELLLDVRYSPKNVEITILTSGKIEQGNSLTLICKSNANPAVTNYTWFKIRDGNISSIGFDCEFSIKAASQKDDGQYFCTAKNDMGSQNSTIIALKVEVPDRHFLLTATALLFFVIVVLLVLFGLNIRRKQITPKKQPTEQTPAVTVTEEIYENLRKSPESEESHTNLIYADLNLPSLTSDSLFYRSHSNSQEDDAVVYSLLSNKE